MNDASRATPRRGPLGWLDFLLWLEEDKAPGEAAQAQEDQSPVLPEHPLQEDRGDQGPSSERSSEGGSTLGPGGGCYVFRTSLSMSLSILISSPPSVGIRRKKEARLPHSVWSLSHVCRVCRHMHEHTNPWTFAFLAPQNVPSHRQAEAPLCSWPPTSTLPVHWPFTHPWTRAGPGKGSREAWSAFSPFLVSFPIFALSII